MRSPEGLRRTRGWSIWVEEYREAGRMGVTALAPIHLNLPHARGSIASMSAPDPRWRRPLRVALLGVISAAITAWIWWRLFHPPAVVPEPPPTAPRRFLDGGSSRRPPTSATRRLAHESSGQASEQGSGQAASAMGRAKRT